MTTKTITIKEAAEKYVAHLTELGKNERTVITCPCATGLLNKTTRKTENGRIRKEIFW